MSSATVARRSHSRLYKSAMSEQNSFVQLKFCVPHWRDYFTIYKDVQSSAIIWKAVNSFTFVVAPNLPVTSSACYKDFLNASMSFLIFSYRSRGIWKVRWNSLSLNRGIPWQYEPQRSLPSYLFFRFDVKVTVCSLSYLRTTSIILRTFVAFVRHHSDARRSSSQIGYQFVFGQRTVAVPVAVMNAISNAGRLDRVLMRFASLWRFPPHPTLSSATTLPPCFRLS